MTFWIQNSQKFWYWKIKAKSNIKDFLRQVVCCFAINRIRQECKDGFLWFPLCDVSFLLLPGSDQIYLRISQTISQLVCFT